jgi:hypothetical protein
MGSPRALTAEEVRARFLDLVHSYVRYWDQEVEGQDTRERLEGLAFSILVILDGGSVSLPAFAVTPAPHPSDEEFHRSRGEDWFPEGVDIAGDLHHEFVGKGRRRNDG